MIVTPSYSLAIRTQLVLQRRTTITTVCTGFKGQHEFMLSILKNIFESRNKIFSIKNWERLNLYLDFCHLGLTCFVCTAIQGMQYFPVTFLIFFLNYLPSSGIAFCVRSAYTVMCLHTRRSPSMLVFEWLSHMICWMLHFLC